MVISELLDRIRLLFVSEKKPFLQLKAILGFYPHNIQLYQLALMHKSVAYHEREKGKGERVKGQRASQEKSVLNVIRRKKKPFPVLSSHANNERLEFLGDAVLSAIVADILYKHYGNKQEGFLTSLRSKLVCRNTLNKLAVDLGLDKLIQHTGAVTTGHNSFMNGNAFEAFFGAIYLDRGYRYCYRFLEERVFKHYIQIEKVARQEQNFKSSFIEWCQKHQFQFVFVQKELRDKANCHTPMFHSTAQVEGISCGTGDGYSKKESDQNAARQALKRIKRDKELLAGIRQAAARAREQELRAESQHESVVEQ